jgi:hypothetical protein
MSMARRLLLLVALLMGLTALAASIAPREEEVNPPPKVEQPLASPSAEPADDQETVTETLSTDENDARDVIVADRGDVVHLTVSGRAVDAVQIVGLDLIEPIDPRTPAIFEFVADTPGTFDVALLEEPRVVGRLRIR